MGYFENHSLCSEPYWTISAEFEKKGHIITAHYYQQKISVLSQASSIVNACTKQDGRITKIEKQKVTLRAPAPFNIGDLQKEAYRLFRLHSINCREVIHCCINFLSKDI